MIWFTFFSFLDEDDDDEEEDWGVFFTFYVPIITFLNEYSRKVSTW